MSAQAKRKIREFYLRELPKMLSNVDIERWLGPNCIIKYSDLDNYRSINELLPHPKSFKIVLIETSSGVGHWTALMRYGRERGDIIEWFNSYGTAPEHDFNFIATHIRHLLGQGGNILTKLLKTKEPWQKVFYNKMKCQKIDPEINTCGRWCIARVLAMLCGWELDDFINKVKDKMQETGKPSDILVVDWIPS